MLNILLKVMKGSIDDNSLILGSDACIPFGSTRQGRGPLSVTCLPLTMDCCIGFGAYFDNSVVEVCIMNQIWQFRKEQYVFLFILYV